MKLNTILFASLIGSSLVACGDNEPVPFPSSCLEARNGQVLPEGEQTLYFQNDEQKPWTAWCRGDDEYLTLADHQMNYGELASNGLAVGTTVRTEYKRVRIDPETLTVDISDQTYALSSGKATLNGVEVTSMPLGVAMACDGDTTWATSMMSLRDTPFVITTKYVTAGTAAAGNSDPWSDEQTVEGWAHGACGYLAPAGMAGMPINTLEDGFVLKLDWKK